MKSVSLRRKDEFCSDSFTEFIVHQQRRALTFAQQVFAVIHLISMIICSVR